MLTTFAILTLAACYYGAARLYVREQAARREARARRYASESR
jgi:hypothetical protein